MLLEILDEIDASLLVSGNADSQLVCLSPEDGESLSDTRNRFPGSAGIAVQDSRLAIAGRNSISIFRKLPGQATFEPDEREAARADCCWVPRNTIHTGYLDIHELQFAQGEVWAANTRYSCLCTFDEEYTFIPRWKPYFIDQLSPVDCCHINGLAVDQGQPRYVTALGNGSTENSWRSTILTGGILLDVPSNQVVLSELPMPHSPRCVGNNLFLLLSASQELVQVDENREQYEVVTELPGYPRGMDIVGDYAFVGVSCPRYSESDQDFARLNAEWGGRSASVAVVHLPSGRLLNPVYSVSGLTDIYDVRLLPGTRRPFVWSALRPGACSSFGVHLPCTRENRLASVEHDDSRSSLTH